VSHLLSVDIALDPPVCEYCSLAITALGCVMRGLAFASRHALTRPLHFDRPGTPFLWLPSTPRDDVADTTMQRFWLRPHNGVPMHDWHAQLGTQSTLNVTSTPM
jgi:hypothetical protein